MNDLMVINMNALSLEDSDAMRCAEHSYFHTKELRYIKSTCNNESDVAPKTTDGNGPDCLTSPDYTVLANVAKISNILCFFPASWICWQFVQPQLTGSTLQLKYIELTVQQNR
jgi:hypothetical protein